MEVKGEGGEGDELFGSGLAYVRFHDLLRIVFPNELVLTITITKA